MWDSGCLDQLSNAVITLDKKNVERLCAELVDHVTGTEQLFPEREAKQILGLLRRKRFFTPMCEVADALLQSGQTAGNIRRQYAQGLIEKGQFSAAIGVLEKLIQECPETPAELAEARGLIGRALKQQYVNNPKKTPAQSRNLNRAVAIYHQVYVTKPDEFLWHGINAVALAKRAVRDGIVIDTKFDADAVAEAILNVVSGKTPEALYAFDIATAAEACVARGRYAEALDWLRQYVAAAGTDAFEVGSTLRQFREVWSLSDSGEGGDLVAVLEAALLMREGGLVSLSPKDIKTTVERADSRQSAFEKVFGKDGPVNYQWYVEGATRARGVGRVEDQFQRPIGSGFLIRATDFFSWAKPDEVLFLTNAHVMGRTESGAINPKDAVVRFEGFDPKRTWAVKDLIWESPMGELDATVARLESVPAELAPFPLAPALEPEFLEGGVRSFYIIGYPKGGALAISLHDNTQVGWRRPLLHYRTPTEPGSSGSPVFDDRWQLVALHHAGGKEMQRLDGHAGFYEANEGIWIHEIIKRTRETAAPEGVAVTSALAAVLAQPTTSAAVAPPNKRRGVFVSYSHKDKKYLGELQTFLKPSVRAEELQKWDDSDIRPGEDWLAEIRKAMHTCQVAILLVSQDYLASDFISAEEFPKIIEAGVSGGLKVFWIALSPSTVERTALAPLQAANDPARPLTVLSKPERTKAWLEIVKRLEKVLK
jgi:tetratricopeptide (TPR) repeat protein